MKLPKQWNHWAQDSHMWLHGPAYKKGMKWTYLRGHGRVWRLNRYGEFQCGDTYAEFDRWALCDITATSIPTSRQEFRAAVKTLLEMKVK